MVIIELSRCCHCWPAKAEHAKSSARIKKITVQGHDEPAEDEMATVGVVW
jgi:hypothetical protein